MNLDDPKLTAYALGELTDPVELTEVETWLATAPEGRAFVADTQSMAAFLSENLHASSMGLTDAQREQILAQEKVIPIHSGRRTWSMLGLAALAACLAAAPLLPWTELLRLRDSSAPTVAINDKPMTLQMPAEAKKEDQKLAEAPAAQLQAKPLVVTPQMRSDTQPASITLQTATQSDTALAQKDADELDSTLRAKQPMKEAETMPASALASAPRMNNTLAPGVANGSGKSVQYPAIVGGVVSADAFTDLSSADKTRRSESPNTEAYDAVTENDFLAARDNPLSTFSIDVDTASYANVRRMLRDGQLPPKGAVRVEEMLNYFTYDYAPPTGDAPFSTHLEVATCPWQPDHRLVRIGLKGRDIPVTERKPANLVFLIDVSGSMDEPNKLPLLQQSLRLLVDQLGENDRVAIAVYAGNSGLVLPSTSNKTAIRDALANLKAGGSTNGASGIRLAYEQAAAHFQRDGVNRVILATDGDFNVGVTNQSDLTDLITEKAKSGVFLSVLGFGTGNLKDSTMEKLADRGNGNYAYIDSLQEGRKVLVEQMGGTLVTIAKDVKIQVEFNPAIVSNYRLVGYENRALKKEDFADDKKDAGEIGSGHTVTALYEVVMVGSMSTEVQAEPLRYQNNSIQMKMATLPSGEMLTVKLRYKDPAGDTSKLLEFPLTDDHKKLETASRDFQFASAVAEFAELLRQSKHSQHASWDALIARAADAKGEDRSGYRAEFIELARRAQALTRKKDS